MTNWVIIPIHRKEDRRKCIKYRGISFLSLCGKVYAKCLEERCREKFESKLDDIHFRSGRSTTDQIYTLQQIFEKSCMPKTSTHVLSASRKHTTGFLVKSFGECCWSTVLTVASYWPSSHCIPAQKSVAASVELNHNRAPW